MSTRKSTEWIRYGADYHRLMVSLSLCLGGADCKYASNKGVCLWSLLRRPCVSIPHFSCLFITHTIREIFARERSQRTFITSAQNDNSNFRCPLRTTTTTAQCNQLGQENSLQQKRRSLGDAASVDSPQEHNISGNLSRTQHYELFRPPHRAQEPNRREAPKTKWPASGSIFNFTFPQLRTHQTETLHLQFEHQPVVTLTVYK